MTARTDGRRAIDLSAYRTDELADRIGSILSLPDRIGSLLQTTIVVLATVSLASVGSLFAAAVPWWAMLLGWLYSVVAGLVLGVLAAVLFLVRAEIGKAEELLVELVRTSVLALGDVDGIVRGEADPPSAAELVDAAWHQVFVPVLSRVASKQLGPFGRPVGWVLQLVVGRGVGTLVTWLAARLEGAPEEEGPVPSEVLEAVQAVRTAEAEAEVSDETVRHIERVLRALQAAAAHVRTVALVLRRLLIPLWLGFLGAIGVATAPLALAIWWATS